MQGDEGRHVEGGLTLASDVRVHVVEDAVSEVGLLVEGSLRGVALSA